MLESSFSRVRFVFLVQGNDWSNVGKLVFKSSIRFLGSGQRLIECWKTRFQEFDSFPWFRATTDRMLESSFSRVRFVYLVQGNDWSNVGKLIFKSSIRFLGSEQRLIECWKARFQEFDSFTWFRARTDRMLESSFSRVRFVFLVQGNDRSNVGKLVFKSSIRFLGSGQGLIECWKAHFQEFDSFSWFRATTDRMLESSFSRVRFVYLVQGNDWSNVGKLIFKSSIRFLGSGQRLIECWKARFQEFDSFTWFRATTDRMLESSFSRVRFVFLVQGNDWSSVGKLVFKSSIRFLGSGQRLIERWKARFQEFDSFSWFRARTDRMLESSFSRVRFVYLVQGNDWSNVGKLVFKSSISLLCSGQRLIECWKAHFQEFDSFTWFRATTDRALESSFSRVRFVFLVQGKDRSNVGKLNFQEFDSFSWFRATTDRMLESSFSRVRFVFLVQGNDWSSVGKLIFKSSIRFLGSGQRLIECWKAHFRVLESWSSVGKLIFKSSIRFLGSGQRLIECWKARFQEFDSFSWFRARTDRMLESSFSRVRFVFLVQGNDWSNVGKLVFKSSIRFLGSGQWLIECWKAHFQEFDSFSWFRARTDRMLESSFSRVKFVFFLRVRFIYLVQGNDWSSVGKLVFKSLMCLLGSGQGPIECWKAHFQEFDSFSWFRATTDRMLENSFSRVRFVFLVQGNDWSNVGKLIFKSSIRFLGSGQRLIECWKAHFQEFDSFTWFRATTDRMLESSFSRVRFVFLVQGNDWSNVGKLVFKSSIRFLGSGQRLIECWKAHFQEFDSFSWFRARTDRMLESSFSRVRFVFLVQGNDWSSVGKLVFKSSIRFLGSGQGPIECWKARFQEFDSFTWFRARTDRMLESSFSRVRFVFLVQGNDWSNVGKLVFKSSIRFLGSGQRLIERWKARFQEFDSFSWFRATTDRMLESSFSKVRFVFLVQGKDWSNVGKLIFKSSIRFLGSGQRLIECWKARFQEFDSFSWFRATTDRMLESSFSRVRFVYLVQGKDWSNVGKLIFKSSIRFLGSGQRLIECWKAHFQEFDSFSWFRARTDRMLESSFTRVRFVFLVQGNDWSNVGKLIFKSSIHLLGSEQWLIERWKAHFQEFDSFSWFRATTDRALESSFSRVRFVFLVQGNDWSSVGKLIFKSSIRFLGSGQRLIECWKTHFQEFDSFSWFRATTDRMLESSFSRVRLVYYVQGNDWSNVGKLVFKSSIRLLGSGQGLIECWKAHFQEFDSFSWFRATTDRMLESSFSRVRFVFLVQGNDWSSVGKLVFKSSIRLLGSGQGLIECWKACLQEFDSFSWFRATTDRMLESSFSRVRFIYLVQGNDWSSVGKLIFKSSIRFLGSGQRLIERWKAHFQEFDSFSWFRATTDRALESSFSRVRFVFLVQGQRLIECWKAHFQEFDSFSWFRATTDRMLESSFSRVRFVFLVQGNDWSNVGKLIFKSSIRFSWFRATTDRMLESSFSRVRFVYLVQGKDWSNVGKLVFKSSIRFLGSGQRLIERWKARFQEFDSFSWFRATTDRMLENSFSRVRFVSLVQGNDWSNVGKLVFKSSIRLLGSGQRLIECWKTHFQEFDSFSLVQGNDWSNVGKLVFREFDSFTWFRARTDRMLESSFSRVRFVFLVQGNDRSNVGKLVFKSSIRFLGSGQRLIECWESSFSRVRFVFLVQGNDWSNVGKLIFKSSIRFTWFRATTDRMLESSFSRVRFVFLVQGNDWSSVGKLVFKSSIRFLGSGQRLIECWKAHFQEFDSFSWFRATTDRALESSFSRVRFVFLGSGQRLIECWKAHFQEFDSFTWFRATTDRMLESSFSRVRLVYYVQGNDWSNCWKAHFQEFDSFTWFRATTDRALESSFSRVRFVFLVQGKDRSNVGKLNFQEFDSFSWFRATTDRMLESSIFKSSIRFLGSGQGLIECWKAHFQEFDSFSWFRATTDRMLESSFSRVRFVFLVQGNDWRKRIELLKMSFPTLDQSLPWTKKTNRTLENWAFQHSIGRCPEPRKRIELLKIELSNIRSVLALNQENESNSWKRAFQRSSIRFLGSGQGPIECWKARFQEFDSFSWFRATTDRMLESSFSRVRFVFLVQGKDWSNVGKLIFKSSIRFLGSGQRLIECWKAHFQEFDSFTWFKATTDRMLESSFSRVRFVFLVQGNDWSNVGKLVFKSSIRFLGSGQRLIECWKARFQEFDSFSWFRATTDRALESSFLRVRFVFLVQGKDWSNVGKLIFKSSIRFLGSGQRLKKTNRTLENELSNIRSVVALNQENESNSWKWAFQHSISPCPEPRKRIELLKTSFPTLDQSLPWTIERWKARFQEFDSFSWFRARTDQMLESSFSRVRFVFLVQGNDWSNVGKLVFKSSIRFLGSGQRLIECWKARFQEFDSFSWFRATTEGNELNSWKRAFQHSISRCPEPRKRIELLKTSFPTFDQSLPWTKKTNRTLENELSNIRSVLALNIVNESNSWKRAFQHSISRCPEPRKRIELLKTSFPIEPRKRIELLKMSFPTFNQSLPWTKKTNRTLENELSNIRSVLALNQENESNSWKRAFQHSISRCPEPSNVGKLIFKSSIRFLGSGQGLIECWKTRFQEFDSFSWFRATTDRMLESSFSRVRFIYLVQGNDWSSVGKLIFKSLIRFLGSGQGLIECWKAHFQEFDLFSWFRATTEVNESNSWKWAFQHFDQSLPWTKKTNRTLENELSNIRSVLALNQENESNSWKWAFQRSISRCPEPRKRIELLKMSFPTFDQSLPWTK